LLVRAPVADREIRRGERAAGCSLEDTALFVGDMGYPAYALNTLEAGQPGCCYLPEALLIEIGRRDHDPLCGLQYVGVVGKAFQQQA
jgi:hypothetical protein